MKKIITLILIFFICISSYAQNGFLFQPQIGFGVSKISGIEQPNIACDCGLVTGEQKTVLTFNVETKITYQFDHFRFSTGFQYLRTGAAQNIGLNSFPSGRGSITPVSDNYAHYDHVLIPISFGFNIPLKTKWSLAPELGTNFLFIKENNSSFSNSDNFFFSAKLNFEREITKSISIVITPVYYNIITPVYFHENDNAAFPTYLHYRAANHIFMLQGGVLCHFPHKAKAKIRNGKNTLNK